MSMRPSFQQVQNQAMEDQYARDKAGFHETFGRQGFLQDPKIRQYWDAMNAGNGSAPNMMSERLKMSNPFAPSPMNNSTPGLNTGMQIRTQHQPIQQYQPRNVNGIVNGHKIPNVFS